MKILEKNRRRKFKPVVEAAKTRKRWNIVRGDKVQVIGRHREAGKQGIVKEVIRKIQRIVVEGINMKTKFLKGDPERGIKGGRAVQRELSMPYSAVALLDPVHNVPTRIVRKFLDDGTKVRVAVKSGEIIPKPEILRVRRRPIRTSLTESCTTEEDAWEMTYVPPAPLVPGGKPEGALRRGFPVFMKPVFMKPPVRGPRRPFR